MSSSIAFQCSMVGPWVTSQQVGQYFSNRAAREERRPRAQAKTPEQLRLLEESFAEEPYPYVGEIILLTWQTGLRPEQVKRWFDQKRSRYLRRGNRGRLDLEMMSRNVPFQDLLDVSQVAKRMWREYRKDPERYARDIWLGIINPRNGGRTGVRVEKADYENWDSQWGEDRVVEGEEDDADDFLEDHE